MQPVVISEDAMVRLQGVHEAWGTSPLHALKIAQLAREDLADIVDTAVVSRDGKVAVYNHERATRIGPDDRNNGLSFSYLKLPDDVGSISMILAYFGFGPNVDLKRVIEEFLHGVMSNGVQPPVLSIYK